MDHMYFSDKGAAWKMYSDDRVEWIAVLWRGKKLCLDEKTVDALLADGSTYDIVVEDVSREQAVSTVTTALDELAEAVNG